jgi:hypothetical protein
LRRYRGSRDVLAEKEVKRRMDSICAITLDRDTLWMPGSG